MIASETALTFVHHFHICVYIYIFIYIYILYICIKRKNGVKRSDLNSAWLFRMDAL